MSRELNHLKTGLILILALVLHSIPSLARDYVYQNPDTQNAYQVQVQNKTNTVQPIWILFYEDEFLEEHYFDIPAGTTKNIQLDGLKKPAWSFSVLSKSKYVLPTAQNWEWSPSTRYEMKLKNQKEIALKFFNLYLTKQKVKMTYVNLAGETLSYSEFYTASFRQNISRLEKVPFGASRLIMESEAPIQISSSENFMPAIDKQRIAPSSFKYFLVQGGTDGTNFVAPIDDPALIQRAREEILKPQGYIVFANIELNVNQPNRNFSSPEKSYWSWSIKKVTGMSQIGADWCQAYPEMIERMLHGFLKQESVCFRGQRIIRELKPAEVQSGILNK